MKRPAEIKPAVPASLLDHLDCRAGTIKSVDEVPSSDKLFRLIVDLRSHPARIQTETEERS
jgi:tRNA-binding EMAP/Myf-like protein